MNGKRERKKRRKGNKGLFQDWKKALLFSLISFFLGLAIALIYLHPGDSTKVRTPESVGTQSEEEEQLARTLKEEEEEGRFLEEYSVRGKICLVLDDAGFGEDRVLRFFKMGVPVSVAVLPGGEYSRRLARRAINKGFTVLLHMPMESESGVEDGTNEFMLNVGMSESEVRLKLDKAIRWVPGASGVSNHMGSRFTRDPGGMRYLVKELKEKGLFFLDSKTTSQSVAPFVCRVSGVNLLVRDVFIDNEKDADSIRSQFEVLKSKASEKGFAVGILHPGQLVIPAVEELVKESLLEGYRFVTLAEVLESG